MLNRFSLRPRPAPRATHPAPRATRPAPPTTCPAPRMIHCLQEVAGEVDDAYREFQAEREDLLDSLRLLDHQMALKDLVIQVGAQHAQHGTAQHSTAWCSAVQRSVLVTQRLGALLTSLATLPA